MAHDRLGPSIRIEVEGIEVDAEVSKYITKCVVEQTEDMADKITLTVLNVAEDVLGSGLTGQYAFTDSKIFQPGNTVKVYMGYAAQEEFVGAGIIQKFLPNFPDAGPATLQIICYDGSVLMMDGATSRDGEVWRDVAHSDVVLSVANHYAFIASIEESSGIDYFNKAAGQVTSVRVGVEKQTTKKRGMSDWELVSGLARLHGYNVKVRWNERLNTWHLHWGANIYAQTKQFTFTYSIAGDDNTLLSFQPEMGLKGIPSTVKVLYFDKDSRTWEEIKLEESKTLQEDLKFTGGGRLEDEITSSSAYRMTASGVSVEVVPGIHFDDAESAQLYAERFFRARKDQFIMGRGKTIGLETLRVGDVHRLEGLGIQLSGEYQFTTVRHIYDAGNGYHNEFNAHKILF